MTTNDTPRNDLSSAIFVATSLNFLADVDHKIQLPGWTHQLRMMQGVTHIYVIHTLADQVSLEHPTPMGRGGGVGE